MTNLKVAINQFISKAGDWDYNLQKTLEGIRAAGKGGARVVVFPEMSLTGYDLPIAVPHAKEIEDASFDVLKTAARDNDLWTILGCPTKKDGRIYNSVIIFSPDGTIAGKYDKMHLFTYKDFRESDFFAPGETAFVFESDFGLFGVVICYDLRFPELARSMAGAGAKTIFACGAFPKPRGDMWVTLLKANAIISQSYVVGVNRGGTDGAFEFAGNSAVINPLGQSLVCAEHNHAETLFAEIDFAMVEETRATIPAWSNLREKYTASKE